MPHRVVQRTLDGSLIASDAFDSLDEALEDASSYGGFSGPRPIEIVVIDENGIEVSKRVFDDADRA